MAGEFKTVCGAITTFLNEPAQQAGFAETFTVARRNRPFTELESTELLRVFVIPVQRTRQRDTRTSWDLRIQILIQLVKQIKVLGDATTTAEDKRLAEEDKLMQVADEIEQVLMTQPSFGGFQVVPDSFQAKGPMSEGSETRSSVFVTGVSFFLRTSVNG